MSRLNVLEVLDRIEKEKLTTFSPRVFSRIFNASPQKVKVFLSRNTKRGYFVRLRKGLYSAKSLPASSLELANIVYRPSYISLELALSYYKLIPEVIYSATSITTKPTKEITILNQVFQYHKINKSLYFGYRTEKIGNTHIVMASKEKALLDFSYFIALGQKRYNDRISVIKIDKEKFDQYKKRFLKNLHNRFVKKRFVVLLQQISSKL